MPLNIKKLKIKYDQYLNILYYYLQQFFEKVKSIIIN